MLSSLSFPKYDFKTKNEGNKTLVFDELRKKWIILSPEENVRQHLWKYLFTEYNYPKSLMICEKKVVVNSLIKRFDLLIYNRDGKPMILVECKAPSIKLDQNVLDQVLRYNINLKCEFILLTNGIEIQCCKINFKTGAFSFLNKIPNFNENS